MNINKKIIDVLLVDDDKSDRRLTKLVMAKPSQAIQFNVKAAETLSEATEHLRHGNYDAILLDLGLPDSNGIDTVRKVHNTSPDTPVIVLTGLDDEEMGLEAIKSGAEDYVVKGKALEHVLVRTIQYAIERKQIKNVLEVAKKQAEEGTLAKSRFLANMSHEIRTPMNAIMGFGDLLSDEDITDQQRGYVNTIINSGKHLLQVIDDILDFSKIEAGKLDIEMSECSLRDLSAVIESIIHPSVAEKDLKFEIREDSSLPANIHTDQARLQQCLINLVNNAIKFTEQGHVYVKVSLEDKDNQPYIRFDVEDTGIGISPEKQEKVFESFTQADGGTSRKYGGTGLGLAITRQLAKLLGGELTLTSEIGKGSVFSLIIPAGLDVTKQPLLDRYNIASHTNMGREQTEQPEFSGRVLVAEDVVTNQMLIKSLLKPMGLEVTITADGNEALQEALTHEFDLILMDIQMPYMNGYEATRAIRKEGITTPIIALTAYAMKGDDKKCFEAGCDDYLAKPLDRKKLSKILRKYLSAKSTAFQR
jgi:signal transduction histidine kinase